MSEKSKDVKRFSKIVLENWKNFARVEVPLQRRVFLVGPNASGKSNFLDVFRFLGHLASPGGGFREAIMRRGGVSAIRCLAARRYPDVAVSVIVEAGDGSARWEYELRFYQDNQRRPLVRKEKVILDGNVLLNRPDEDDKKDPERLTQTHLEQVNVNRSFREIVSYFESVRYLHIVPQLVREPDRSVGRPNDPYGGDFLEQLAKTQERTRMARLRRIQDALRVAVPQLKEIELWRDARGTPHLRGKYEHWRPQGAWQTEEQFSDGTLRLMGLLWAVMEGSGPVLLEEPELSLHPEIVHFLPQMFARVQRRTGKQIILSTHSPDLLRDEGIGLDEVLLLSPSLEGTAVRPASDFDEIRHLLEGGVTLAEAVIPKTRPEKAEQLSLFGDL
ncbi:AAA family ATPase [Candidatus Methylomirabilis sp.]|uniref:AAA family ATPase n=1 Tax=Candidatus Methylomirabilis sp. TaxID=2032687 RepID=UPI002A66FD8F|nr:AAA family ATPase [Candidatus Methylomirabilis sp.]